MQLPGWEMCSLRQRRRQITGKIRASRVEKWEKRRETRDEEEAEKIQTTESPWRGHRERERERERERDFLSALFIANPSPAVQNKREKQIKNQHIQ